MADFAKGFATGFLNTMNEKVSKRKDDADAWYAQRAEEARMIAMQRRGKASGKIDGYVSVARQLEGLGVPKDIVLATANQNPEDLSAMYENVSKWQFEGVPMDEEFFRAAYKVKGVVNPNTTYDEFFNQMYLPVKRAAEADPEGFRADPEGSIFAAMLGYGAQDKAQERLANTDIMGRPADQWLYDTEERNRPLGDSGVDVDYGMLGDAMRKPVQVNPNEVVSLSSSYAKRVEERILFHIGNEDMGIEEARERANHEAGEWFAGIVQGNPNALATFQALPLEQWQYIAPYLGGEEGGEEGAPPPSSGYTREDWMTLPDGSQFVEVIPGTNKSLWVGEDGQTFERENSEAIKLWEETQGESPEEVPVDDSVPEEAVGEEPVVEEDVVNPLDTPEISKAVGDRLVKFGQSLPPEDQGLFQSVVKSVRPTLKKVLDDSLEMAPTGEEVSPEVVATPQWKMVDQAFPMAPPEFKLNLYKTMTSSIDSIAMPKQQDMFRQVWQESLGAIADLL